MTFDQNTFLNWLTTQEGPITQPTLEAEWREFPWKKLAGVPATLAAGEPAYAKRDLRRVTAGRGYLA